MALKKIQDKDVMLRILLVEDDSATLGLLKTTLERAGCTVYPAMSGSVAYHAIDIEERIEAAVIDHRLPDAVGTDIALYVAEKHPETKVVMITGNPDPVDKIIRERCMPWVVLVKPFYGADLLEKIEQLTNVKMV